MGSHCPRQPPRVTAGPRPHRHLLATPTAQHRPGSRASVPTPRAPRATLIYSLKTSCAYAAETQPLCQPPPVPAPAALAPFSLSPSPPARPSTGSQSTGLPKSPTEGLWSLLLTSAGPHVTHPSSPQSQPPQSPGLQAHPGHGHLIHLPNASWMPALLPTPPCPLVT